MAEQFYQLHGVFAYEYIPDPPMPTSPRLKQERRAISSIKEQLTGYFQSLDDKVECLDTTEEDPMDYPSIYWDLREAIAWREKLSRRKYVRKRGKYTPEREMQDMPEDSEIVSFNSAYRPTMIQLFKKMERAPQTSGEHYVALKFLVERHVKDALAFYIKREIELDAGPKAVRPCYSRSQNRLFNYLKRFIPPEFFRKVATSGSLRAKIFKSGSYKKQTQLAKTAPSKEKDKPIPPPKIPPKNPRRYYKMAASKTHDHHNASAKLPRYPPRVHIRNESVLERGNVREITFTSFSPPPSPSQPRSTSVWDQGEKKPETETLGKGPSFFKWATLTLSTKGGNGGKPEDRSEIDRGHGCDWTSGKDERNSNSQL
ncbi:hypothetical protein FQN54_006014 [Arachnomyces sp. PD_36]|nr:hypothetical protein FQN54_006014 [Arachnomyces sp. PD_36]